MKLWRPMGWTLRRPERRDLDEVVFHKRPQARFLLQYSAVATARAIGKRNRDERRRARQKTEINYCPGVQDS